MTRISTLMLMGLLLISTVRTNANDKQVTPIGFIKTQFLIDDGPVRFHIPIARLGFRGSVHENINFTFVAGTLEGPDRNPALVNAFADYRLSDRISLRAGQFLMPFGIEGARPIPAIQFADRSNAVRSLNSFRMFRDIGVMVMGNSGSLVYNFALVNGNGANTIEQSDDKDIVGRLAFSLIDDMTFGISGHSKLSQDDELRRFGADVEYYRDSYLLLSEFIYRYDDTSAIEGRAALGGYVTVGYLFQQNSRVLLRLDYLNADLDMDNAITMGYGAGYAYHFQGNNRVSLNYIAYDNDLDKELNHNLLLEFQMAF